ncbi:MAG: hypothetical protein ABR547_03835 [Halanaerobium sp.]
MRKKLILLLIVLMGVFLLSGCSSDGDSLNDESAVLKTVKALEEDLDSLAVNPLSGEVNGDWSDDYNFGFTFSGVETNIDDLNLFKNIFILAADSMRINSVEFNVQSPVINSNNKATVNADLLSSEPEAMSNGIDYNIIIDLSKTDNKWFIESFEIRIDDQEVLSEELGDVYGDGSVKIYYPVGDTWSKPGSDNFLDGGIKLESKYYSDNENFKVISSYPKYSTLSVDKGKINGENIENLSDLEKIINQKTEYEEEIKNLSKNLLESLYGGEINITIKIDDFIIEKVELVEDNVLISDMSIKLSPDIEAPDYDININGKISLNYKFKIIYKLYGSNLYLAAYAAPELYYNEDLVEKLISNFNIYLG